MDRGESREQYFPEPDMALRSPYPDPEKLVQLADYFQVSTDYLLGRREYTKGNKYAQPHHSQDEMLKKISHSLLQLPEDRRQALALIISDMERSYTASDEGDFR